MGCEKSECGQSGSVDENHFDQSGSKLLYRAVARPARRPLRLAQASQPLDPRPRVHGPDSSLQRPDGPRPAEPPGPAPPPKSPTSNSQLQACSNFSFDLNLCQGTLCVRRASDCGMRVACAHEIARDRHEISPRDRTATSSPVRLGPPRPETIFTRYSP